MKDFRKVALAAVFFAAMSVSPVAAQESNEANASEEEQEEIVVSDSLAEEEQDDEEANEVVCRRQAPTVGSRLGARRVCMTQREWQALEDGAERFLRSGSDSIGGAPNYPTGRGGG